MKKLRFVVHKHKARRLHYDLRIQVGKNLRSFAIPKQPPLQAGIKRLAIDTGKREIAALNFEGIIPKGHYGAGTLKIWDKGTFEFEKKKPKEILFIFKGKKLKGRYNLIKTRFGWLFIKSRKRF